jgi:hypothetical protein
MKRKRIAIHVVFVLLASASLSFIASGPAWAEPPTVLVHPFRSC